MNDLLVKTSVPGTEAVQNWLYDYIEHVLDFDKADIVSDVPLQNLGLDSSSAVGLISDLAAWSGVPLGVKVLRTHNSIKSLAEYVARNH